jgi:hypothetical protein
MKGDSMRLSIRNALFGVFLFCIVSTANAGEVSKEVWMNAMSTVLPTAFCQAKQYFRQCFEVTQTECEETASSATRICLDKYKQEIPDVLNQPSDGNYWGRIIGTCAGGAYAMTFQKRLISSEQCNNLANWQ